LWNAVANFQDVDALNKAGFYNYLLDLIHYKAGTDNKPEENLAAVFLYNFLHPERPVIPD